jgi:WD40 repeat protein
VDGAVVAQLRTGTPRELITAQFSADGNSLYLCGTVEGFSHVPLQRNGDTVQLGERTTIDATPDFYLRDRSDDGTKLVLVSPRRGRVKVFALDRETSPQLLSEWETAGPYGAAFGASGQQLLINHDDSVANFPGGTLRVWDIATRQPVHTLDAPLSADADWNDRAGVAITTNGRNDSVLWRAGSWTRGAPLPVEARGNFTCFSISPDGTMVAIGTGAGVQLVDTASGRSLAVLNRGVAFGFPNAVLFSPDGHKIAAQNGDCLVHVWDLPTLRTALQSLHLDW